ncbi:MULTISPECIES: RNA polymerase sigma factor SigY [Cytobacillus]|uniref:RNA polymerase sigma factor SigY n=1 Tax=Cytobacillus TaxID=2675230 RepID=UPI0001F4485D|nr:MULTISPECIES: RNA polymerase sigma factor SigY [Cytobacillus]EFV78829.1 RNA polymerase sigma-70 factor [Bacillus sp. 2_A_57_CT2]MCS0824963.1 RNA polymerase sigma factor SigY [Cytobacillus firmus]MBU8732104.1 RNA polymerase sigma factor SigY [Cytobacillus oceanisediminis]MCM3241209.1 RNA polymerase sigma factor SigY [Cytobacillus oceanisediminis]MCM3404169.1 RNA polymerase sigma factor SigY [Cytobacillus oceanisediminis]
MIEKRGKKLMEEKDLIISAKRGDQLAFAMLFKNNYPFLVKYLIKITMNPDAAEELAQETMAKCVEKIGLFNGKAKFSSWLISIATNLYIDQKRKSKRERNWKAEEEVSRRMKWHLESRNEEWNDALSALGKLKDEIRIPIVLKHYYGYSYEEIGEMMKISSGTVKSRVHNGIMSVREELKLHDEQEITAARSRSSR